MIRRLAGFSLALAIGATVLHAQDTIDPKTGKKRGPMEVLRDRDRPGKAPSTSPAPRPNPNPTHDVYRIHDRDREERERIARHEERERRERFERERRERERIERERHERFERAHANPPGWSKGKKTGWGDCDLPPGQAKKYGCHSHDRSHRHKHRG
jgi:hypothetical protein